MQVRMILGESHIDPITNKIHQKLALLIKKVHPDWKISFLDEMHPKTTIDGQLKNIDVSTDLWVRAAILVKEQANIDLIPENLNHPYFSKKPGKDLVFFTKRYFADLAFKELLNTLKANNITYKGIDSELMSLKIDEEKLTSLAIMCASMRDKIMGEALAKQDGFVLSRIGLMHAEGVYQKMRETLPPEAICMYNIYSQLPLAGDVVEYEKHVRLGEKDFITPVNATGKSEEEMDKIVNDIFLDIEKRQLALDKLPAARKLTLVESKVNPVKARIKNNDLIDVNIIESYPPTPLMFKPLTYHQSGSAKHLDSLQPAKAELKREEKTYEYGDNESESKIINANLEKAEKLGLLKENNQIESLHWKRMTVESFFKHENCVSVLQLKKFTLKDIDPLPIDFVASLLSDEGLYCLNQNLITFAKAKDMKIFDLNDFLKTEYGKKDSVQMSYRLR